MKTTIFILTAIFTLNTMLLSAINPKVNLNKINPPANETMAMNLDLMPKTPNTIMEDDADGIEVNPACLMTLVKSLAPETPNEVTLEEPESTLPVDLNMLVPEIPTEVGLEESEPEENPVSLIELAPAITPLPTSL